MAENNSYALWIIPPGEAYTLTNGYIARLSKSFHLPKFEPHVTVLAGLRLEQASQMRALAGGLAPFRVRLAREAEYLDEYFRCLFLPAHQMAELMDLFSKVSELFGYQGRPYFPHLSLAYGDLPVETKQEMIRELGPIPPIQFEARAISLVHGSQAIPPESWRVVERFQLSGPG
jgi:2'-5' RNA ligase